MTAGASELRALEAALEGRYEVLRLLGVGGQGRVFQAFDRGRRVPVAIKVLESSDVAEDAARFEREAAILTRLHSPHIVEIVHFGTLPSGAKYLVMELLVGTTLARVLEGIAAADLVRVVCDVCQGLAVAHEAGVVHRDIKPANVFVERSRGGYVARIVDFGIARDFTAAALTRTLATLGTPRYMAPEQIFDPVGVDARADLFSLGVVLYEGLTGRRPWQGRSLDELAIAMEMRPPVAPDVLVPTLPAELASVVMRCLARDREERPRSARALAASLAPFARPRSAKVSWVFVAVAAVTVVVGLVATAFVARGRPPARLATFAPPRASYPALPPPPDPPEVPTETPSPAPPSPPAVASAKFWIQGRFNLPNDGGSAWFERVKPALAACRAVPSCGEGFMVVVHADEPRFTGRCKPTAQAEACLDETLRRSNPRFECVDGTAECYLMLRFE